MANKVYCNIADNRLLDGGQVVEDVTSVGLPTISHPSTTINGSGMAMAVDMPDITHLEAMEMTIQHNNGVNGNLLGKPGKHNLEFRAARQRYNIPKGQLGFEGMKIRVIGVHKSTQKGNIETGSPYGSTETYSILKYEEELNGKIITLIDAMNNIIEFNGIRYTDIVSNLLN